MGEREEMIAWRTGRLSNTLLLSIVLILFLLFATAGAAETQIRKPTAHTDSASSTTNPGNAYDNGTTHDETTASMTAVGNNGNPAIDFSSWNTTDKKGYSALSLTVTVETSGTVDNDQWGLYYDTTTDTTCDDTDSVLKTTAATSTTLTNYTATLPADQNFNDLEVCIVTNKQQSGDGYDLLTYDAYTNATVDTTPPLWRNQQQNVSTVERTNAVNLAAQGKDGGSLSYARLATNESGTWENKTVYGSPMELNTEETWTWSNFTWDNDSVADGTSVGWKIYYNDSNGNYNQTDVQTFTVEDTIGPDITIHSPQNTTARDATPWLNVTADEDVSGWKYDLDGGGNTTFAPNTTLSSLSDGQHNVTVWANDTVGNWNDTVRYFTVDTTPPLWRNQQQNTSNVSTGESIKLAAQGNDTGNLSHAVLATNETGTWANKSVYGSPIQLYTEETWTWSNFTWSNDSISSSTVVGWKIYYNDTSGNYNQTNVKTFNVTIPYIKISYFNSTFLDLDRYDLFNVTVNVTCSGDNTDCGQVSSSLRHNDYDLEPDTPVRDAPFSVVADNARNGIFPKTTNISLEASFNTGGYIDSKPAAVDVDGNGLLDIYIGSDAGDVHRLESDGSSITELNSFSTTTEVETAITVADVNEDGSHEVMFGSEASNDTFFITDHKLNVLDTFHESGESYFGGAASVVDMDDDGTNEIIIGSENGTIHAFNYTAANGLVREGFYKLSQQTWASPAISDVDDDGVAEIIIGGDADTLRVLNHSNSDNMTQEGAYTINGDIDIASAVADIDDDGTKEIVTVSYDDNVHVFNHSNSFGTRREDAFGLGVAGASAPALGDIDQDGVIEIVVGDDNNRVNVLNYSIEASIQREDSYTTGGSIQSFPSLADVDGDGAIEIAVGSNDNKTYLFNHTDNTLSRQGFYEASGNVEHSVIADVDDDGIVEIAVGSGDNNLYVLGAGEYTGKTWELPENNLNNTRYQADGAAPQSLLYCPQDNLRSGETCTLSWTVNATERGSFNIDTNFTSDRSLISDEDSRNRQVNVDIGSLAVDLLSPLPEPYTLDQYWEFNLTAAVDCIGDSDDICGAPEGNARYSNNSEPSIPVNTSTTATPFYITRSQEFLNTSSSWWTAANSPDLHVQEMQSLLQEGVESTTNVTVNVSNYGQGTWNVNVSLWNHSGESITADPVTNLTTDGSIKSMSAGDVNGDGLLDVVSSSLSGNVIIWEQQSGGGFTLASKLSHSGQIETVSLGDVNGDGRLDVASGDDGSNEVVVWEQQSGGGFSSVANLSHSGEVNSVSLGDVNGDGLLDVVAGGASNNVVVWEQQDDGSFTSVTTLSHINDIGSTSLGDVNGDGLLDIVSGDWNYEVVVWEQQSGGGFSSVANLSHDNNVYSAPLGDVNGDGLLDVVAGGASDNVVVWEQQDDGSFAVGANRSVAGNVNSVSLGDVNGDGLLDIVSGDFSGDITVWEQEQNSFTQANTFSNADGVYSVPLGDVNGDGLLDIVSGDWSNEVVVWEQQRASSFIGYDTVSMTDVNGSISTAEITWTPEKLQYNLTAVADLDKNYTSIFRTQDESSAIGNRLHQQISMDDSISQRTCPSALSQGQSCQLNWTVNATGEVNESWFLDVNVSSQDYAGIVENDTQNSEVCIGSCPEGDTLEPQIRNVESNVSAILEGETVEMGAEGRDWVNLSHAVLSTNETGTWENKSGVYDSPQELFTRHEWNWVNFTWQNSSVSAGTTVGWRIWYNDSTDNKNATPIQTVDVVTEPYLSVDIVDPPLRFANVQNETFWLNATATCRAGDCGNVTGRAQYNLSGTRPDTLINAGDQQIRKPDGYTDNAGTTTNPSNAFDFSKIYNQNTSSTTTNAGSDPTMTWENWRTDSLMEYTSLELTVTASASGFSAGGLLGEDDTWSMYYDTTSDTTCDSSDSELKASNTNNPSITNYTAQISADQDLSNIQVCIVTVAANNGDGSVSVYDIRTVGTVNRTPLHIPRERANPEMCDNVSQEETCTVSWKVNATGEIDSWHEIDVNFSTDSVVDPVDTEDSRIHIIGPITDIALNWPSVDFGSLDPTPDRWNPQAALNNSDNLYNVTVTESTTHTVDLWINGTDLQQEDGDDVIGVGNVSYNTENSLSTAANMSKFKEQLYTRASPGSNTTTYYWLNVPGGIYADNYTGTIEVKANAST